MASYSRYPPSSPIRAREPSRPSYGIGLDNSPKRRSTESQRAPKLAAFGPQLLDQPERVELSVARLTGAGRITPLCGRLRVGKNFLYVCSIGRCAHVFGLFARFT